MTTTFVDSHAHLSNPSVALQIEPILERAKEAGISAIINICTSMDELRRGLKLAETNPWIYTAAATTPHDAEIEGEDVFPVMAAHARSGKLVAIGETGLDYFYYRETKEAQKKLLKNNLHLAIDCRLPVIIHCRDAFQDFFDILDRDYVVNGVHGPGVLHCFTGTVQEADEIINRGWFLSLSGIVTFKRSDELREVAKRVPLDQLLIETDTPYLAPQTHRGQPNEPAYLPETAALIASVKGISIEELAHATSENAKKLFNLTTKRSVH